MLKVLSNILCDLDPKVKVIGQKAGICDGVPSTSALVYNLGLWVLGLAVSNINESQLQTYESKTLFLMTSLQYYCIPGLAGTL